MIEHSPEKLRFACFVSSHGFGHATRLVAIIQQLANRINQLDILLFGQIPNWFWFNNLPKNCSFQTIEYETDVGLIQNGPFKHNINQTKLKLLDFLNFKNEKLSLPISRLNSFQPEFILCDISPIGIEVGDRLNIPTILIENFTWDWIYHSYNHEYKGFSKIIDRLEDIYQRVSLRIQCRPFCRNIPGAVKINTVFRESVLKKKKVLDLLNLKHTDNYILVTTGGISMDFQWEGLSSKRDYLVVPGNYQVMHRKKNVIYLPMNANIPFPDLVQASSCVLGKAGYGTVAECWGMNIPFIGVFRTSFRESEVLLEFCKENLNFRRISLESFLNHNWIQHLPELIEKKDLLDKKINGAIKGAMEIIHFSVKSRRSIIK